MTGVSSPVRERLRRIDPETARTRSAAIAALDGLTPGGHAVRAEAAADDAPAPAVVFETWAAPVRMGLPGAHEPLGAAAAVGRIEPLLAEIERALRIELDPAGVEAPAPPGPAAVALRWGPERLWLALPSAALAAAEPRAAVALTPALAGARLPVAVRLAGPRLAPAALAALGVGDLLLLPAEMRAALAVRGAARGAHGLLHLHPLRFRAETADALMKDTPVDTFEPAPPAPDMDAAAALAPDLAATPAAVTVALDQLTLTLGEVAALRSGSLVEFGEPGGALAARVIVGGRTIAEGEIVVVGDAFGLLIGKAG